LPRHHTVFPLYNPASLDALVFWEVPSQERSGRFGVWIDFGSGAWGFGRNNRGSGEHQDQEEHVCGNAKGEDGDHAVSEVLRGGEWNVNSNPVVVNVKC